MTLNIRVDPASVNNVVSNMTQRSNNVVESGKCGLSAAADIIFQDAQAKIPRKTGALANSGKITYRHTKYTSTAVISYGDDTCNPQTNQPTKSYAVERHESPREGKWLENAILGGAEVFLSQLTREISNNF